MSLKEKILLLLILFFLLTLYVPWSPVANVLAVAGLTGYSFFLFSPFAEKWQCFKERKHLHWMFFFICMVVGSVLISRNFNSGLRYLDPRLALIYFPVSVGTLSLRRAFKLKVLLCFAWLTFSVAVLCLGWGIHRSGYFRHPEFLYNDSLTEILDQQSIYTSLLVNLAIYIFGYHLFFTKKRFKAGMGFAMLVLFITSYLLASRVMMAMLYASVLCFAFYCIFKMKQKLRGSLLIVALCACIVVVFAAFPKTWNRFRELTYTTYNYKSEGRESHYNMPVTSDQWNGANFRIAAWQCGWELFLKHPLTGVNIGDKHDVLFDLYKQKGFWFAIQTNKNVHNNYLDILYSLGIIGLTLFLLGWVILPLVYAGRSHDGLSALIIITFAAAWVTEIYFDRSIGGMLTGFFIPFLLTDMRAADKA